MWSVGQDREGGNGVRPRLCGRQRWGGAPRPTGKAQPKTLA